MQCMHTTAILEHVTSSRGEEISSTAAMTLRVAQVASTFWSALPHGTFYPMFIVATLAAIIASQALISAVFQIAAQVWPTSWTQRTCITGMLHTGRFRLLAQPVSRS